MLIMFHFYFRPEKYEVISGPLEKLLPEAMYQMICFRFCSRIQRILHHIIPRKVIAFFEDTFFMGRITFLCLLMFCYCFLKLNLLWMHLLLISLKVHRVVFFLVLLLLFQNAVGSVFCDNIPWIELRFGCLSWCCCAIGTFSLTFHF